MTTLNLETKSLSVDSMILRSGVLNGSTAEGVTFDLDQSGAVLILTVKKDGVTLAVESLPFRTITEKWVTGILER